MNFNLIHPETWASLNSKVHELWGLPSDVSVRVYRGVPHAAFELALGTALFLSHKRSVGLLQGQTPAFQAVLPILYKEAFQVQHQSQAKPAHPMTEWLKALKADNSFLMHTEDNPITGEIFKFQEVDAILNEKKIFSIRTSHRRHLLSQQFSDRGITPSSVQICEINSSLAIAICGSRFKSPVQIAAHLEWNEKEVLEQIHSSTMLVSKDLQLTQALIHKFETHLPEGFQALPSASDSKFGRLYDRSLIYHPDVQGEALETELRKRLGLSAQSEEITSLTQCGRGFLDLSWWDTKPADNVLRNLLVLDQSILQRPELAKALVDAVQACRI